MKLALRGLAVVVAAMGILLASGAARAAEPAKKVVALTRADTEKLLQEAVDLDFAKTSLDNVLRYIGEVKPGLNIVIDPDHTAEGLDFSSRLVTLNAKGITIDAVLKQVLGAEFVHLPMDGYVLVATRAKAERLAAAAMAEAARVQPAAADPKEIADTKALLQNPIDLDFERVSYDSVLKYIGQVVRGLKVEVDPSVKAAGIDLESRLVEIRAKRITVASAFWILMHSDLTCTILPGRVLVVPRFPPTSPGGRTP
jgi:hypothetical protein